jgi:sec-independent protein translocase protein TatB
MFDIGFSELMVIAVVALIVIGPERLPKVARTLGLLFGRMQRYVNDVKADISREMQLEELKKLQQNMEDAARSMQDTVNREIREAETELNKVSQEAASIEPAKLEATGAQETTDAAAGATPQAAPNRSAPPLDPVRVMSADAAATPPVADEHAPQDDTQLQLDLQSPARSDRKSA